MSDTAVRPPLTSRGRQVTSESPRTGGGGGPDGRDPRFAEPVPFRASILERRFAGRNPDGYRNLADIDNGDRHSQAL